MQQDKVVGSVEVHGYVEERVGEATLKPTCQSEMPTGSSSGLWRAQQSIDLPVVPSGDREQSLGLQAL